MKNLPILIKKLVKKKNPNLENLKFAKKKKSKNLFFFASVERVNCGWCLFLISWNEMLQRDKLILLSKIRLSLQCGV